MGVRVRTADRLLKGLQKRIDHPTVVCMQPRGHRGPSDAGQGWLLNEALTRLAEVDKRAARIVELRWFVGLTNNEIAEVPGVSEVTVRREWSFAKAWLQAALEASTPP